MKTKITKLSEQLQNPIPESQKATKSIPLTFTWISTGTSIKSGEVKLILWTQTSPLSERLQLYMLVKFQPLLPPHIYKCSVNVMNLYFNNIYYFKGA